MWPLIRGIAAVNATYENSSIKACNTLDGWGELIIPKKLEKPCLCLFSGHTIELSKEESKNEKTKKEFEKFKKHQKENQESLKEFCNESKACYYIIIKNAAHMAFTDSILFNKKAAQSLRIILGDIEPYVTIKIINDYIRTFFDMYLKEKMITSKELCNLHPEAVIIEKCGSE